MNFVNYKCLESLLIEDKNTTATEGIVGKVIGTTLGAILAGYAILILGIEAQVKSEDKKKSTSYYSKTGISNKDQLKKNVKLKQNEISKNILDSFNKLQSNSTYMTKLRQAIAKKLNIDINKVPTKFKSKIENYDRDILINFMDYNEVYKLYNLNKNDDLADDEFGHWINAQLTPTFNKIITSIKNSGIAEIDSNLIRLEPSDHWQEYGIYVINLS